MKTILLLALGVCCFQFTPGQTCTATISASGPTTFCPGGSVVLTAFPAGSWKRKADLVGVRNGYASTGFSIGDKGYLGTKDDRGAGYKFWEFDPIADTWTQRGLFSMEAAVGFSIAGKGYMGTGLSSASSGYQNSFYEYNPASNLWMTKANFGGLPRINATGFSIGDKGYIGTGRENSYPVNYFSDFWEYDPVTNIWTQKANFGGGTRESATGFSIGNKGYIGTGKSGADNNTRKNDIWEYDPIGNAWIQRANFGGSPRLGATGVSIGNKGYIGTGSETRIDNNGYNYYDETNDFWEFDPVENKWTQMADFGGLPRAELTGFSIGNKGYLGGNPPYNYSTADFWEFNPISSNSNLTYLWSTGETTPSITVTTSGSYTVTITNNANCQANSKPIIVTIKTNLGITFVSASTYTVCTGATTTLTANGITGTNAVVTWWTRPGGSGINLGTGTILENQGAGTYYARVTGDCDPPSEASITINSLPSVTPVSIASVTAATNPLCPGNTTTLTANGVTGTNAIVTWWTGTGGTLTNLGTGTTLPNQGAGTYYARVTGECGVPVEASITIGFVSPPTISASGPVVFCEGESVLLTANYGGSNTWTQRANFGGGSRTNAVAFSIGNKGYIGTGEPFGSYATIPNSNLNDFWEFDPIENTWTQKANFGGTPRRNATGFSIGNKGYIGTGYASNNGLRNDFWEYDPVSNNWTQKADFGGTPRSGTVGFSIGNKGFIGTGSDNIGPKSDFWEYDPLTNNWVQKANFGGTPRSGAVGFSIYNKGYIGIGGDYKNDFWEYDPFTDKWTKKANFAGPNGPGGQVGLSFGSKGYIGTGSRDMYSFYNYFWEYDPLADKWIQMANFGGTPRTLAAGFGIGNKGYIGIGLNSRSYPITDVIDFWEFDPVNNYSNNPTYLWSTGETTNSITASTSGSYTVTVTNDLGCSTTSAAMMVTAKITVGIVSVTAADNPVSTGSTTILTANGVTGTNAIVTWWTGTGGTGTNLGTGITIALGAGTWYARVTGDCGVAAEASITVDLLNIGIVSVTAATNPICAGTTTTLTANGVTGAGALVTWWTGTGGTGTNLGTGTTLSNCGAGTYYARVTGGSDPPAEASVTVSISVIPIPTITTNGSTTLCIGESAVLYSNPSSNPWRQKANFAGGERKNAVGFSIGNKGYIGTGDANGAFKNDFWEYNVIDNTWTQKANFGGAARAEATGFSIANKGYIGTGGTGSNVYNDFWEYDPPSNTWLQKANFSGPLRRNASGLSIGNKGYIGLGYGGSMYLNDFWEYDPVADNWTQKANFGGSARAQATSFSIGNKGYLGTGYDLEDFWEYDPSGNTWTQKANFGGGIRYGASGFGIGNKGYMGLGWGQQKYENDIWEYDPVANNWKQKADLPAVGRAHATGFSIDNKGYIGLGAWMYQKDFWEFAPADYTTFWSTGATTDSITVSTSGNYTVTITNYDGCTATSSPTVVTATTNPIMGIASATASMNPICAGATTTLMANGVTGENAMVIWWTGTGGTGTNLGTGFTLPGMGAGTYFARVTGDCRVPAEASVTVATKTNVGITSATAATNPVCGTATTTLTAIGVTGTNAIVTWWTGSGGTGTNLGTGTTLSNQGAGTYFARVTGDCGNPAEVSITVDLSAIPTITANGPTTFCPGGSVILTANSTSTWANMGDLEGTACIYGVGFSIGNKGYFGTGFYDRLPKNDFWAYDPVTNTLTQKARLPGQGRSQAVGFSIGSKGYIGTGKSSTNNPINDFYEYDPASNNWIRKTNFVGGARFGATGFSIGNKGYISTGWDKVSFKKDLWEYDPFADSWTRKADFAGDARYFATGFNIGNKGYVGTGIDLLNARRNDFWEYDPSNNTWAQRADFGGLSRRLSTGFSIGNKGYIGAGIDNNNTLKNDLWEYDPFANTWQHKAPFGGAARYGAVGFTINNKGYIGAGYDGNYKYDFWEFVPAYSYLWSTGATTPSITVTTSGSYTVTVTNSAGCSSTSGATVVTANCPVAPKFSNTTGPSGIAVSPNPTSGRFLLQLNNIKAGEAVVLILDAKGSVIEKRQLKKEAFPYTISFNLGNNAHGIYLVKLLNEQGVYTAKVVME